MGDDERLGTRFSLNRSGAPRPPSTSRHPTARSSTLVLPEPPTLYTELEEQSVGIILTTPNQRGPMWSMLPDTLS